MKLNTARYGMRRNGNKEETSLICSTSAVRDSGIPKKSADRLRNLSEHITQNFKDEVHQFTILRDNFEGTIVAGAHASVEGARVDLP